MKRAGADDRFLTDEHFETGWRKHFQDLAVDSKHGVKQSFAARNLRARNRAASKPSRPLRRRRWQTDAAI